ncbi:phosphatidylethanolamine-binding protein 4 isoform X4 [Heterodontus francisci]|uniref:phosphatidylethanolamine-binding protein 4 isoform X4 n=1 Tax=Heterodontus francisci TaxID=7792 RepID=UPI00355B008F
MSTTRGCRFKIIRSRTGAMRRRPFTNMKWPVTLILLVGLDILSQQKVSTCVVDQMTDTTFCRGSLQVSYTTIGMVNCVIIPKCFRTLLSTMLGQPSVLFPTADESKNYVLVMVDPDAPCQRNPKYRYWRHWLVTGISGANLRQGVVQGTVLTAYAPPTPPPGSGFHRYQFFLYEHPVAQTISLDGKETRCPGLQKN